MKILYRGIPSYIAVDTKSFEASLHMAKNNTVKLETNSRNAILPYRRKTILLMNFVEATNITSL